MSVRRFATVMGVIPPLLWAPAAGGHEAHTVPVRVNVLDGYLLGLFHVNVLHSLVHVLFGVMGLAMARSFESARLYARIVAVGYGLLTIMGLVPGLNTVFGLIPIHGHDVWLHAAIAAVSAYLGFAGRADDVDDAAPRTA